MISRSDLTPTILIIFTIIVLMSLGFWQLDRADEKRKIESVIVLSKSEPAKLVVDIEEILKKEYYNVLLKGHYDKNKQFIYDNQTVNSNAGYYVLTPFILDDKGVILVNRGFVPWGNQRKVLAEISVNQKEQLIEALLVKPKQRIQLQNTEAKPEFPLLIQSIDIEKLASLSKLPIIPMIAQLSPKSENGFYRKWKPFYGSVDKHLGYALQWFLMALVLCIISSTLALRKRNKSKHL